MDIALGILIPFIGTTFGSSMVFFMKNTLNKNIEKLLLGLTSGVMIAASVWSLLIPAIEMVERNYKMLWLPPSIGFFLGVVFFMIIDFFIANLENKKKNIKNKSMLVFAVTLHNIPEGMAVGVVFASLLLGNVGTTVTAAFTLAIGIAIQNFPEGAIISMPLKCKGNSKAKSFLIGTLSGIVEPISAVITIMLINFVVPILPYLLSFAAGAMIYVVTGELIPESQKEGKSLISTLGLTIGFIIMMSLDISLG